jgi:type VI secretion system ImpB/VipA family protein
MTTRVESDAGDAEGGERAEAEDMPAFRVVVLAELGPTESHRTGPRSEPTAVPITRASFAEVMAAVAASFVIDVPDPFDAAAAVLRVDLRLEDLRSFRPDGLLEAALPLRALAEARRLIDEVPRSGRSASELRAHLARVLPRPEWAARLVGSDPAAATSASPPTPNASDAGIDSILDMVDAKAPSEGRATPPDAPAARNERDPIASLISSVAKSARPPAPRAAGPSPTAVTTAMARLLGAIVAHPEMRRLERLWRSLRLLVDHAASERGVEIYVIATSGDDELAATLDAQADSDAGGFDLVVLGEVLTPTARALEAAKHAAGVGEAIHAPILVSGTPELVGARDLAALGKSSRQLSSVDDPRAVAARAAASHDAMRWMFVALNGPLLRAPWDAQTGRVRGLPFAEDPTDASAWIAALPAFALAALCAKSFARTGWPTPVVAPQTMLDGLAVRETADGGITAALAVEAFVSDDAARELAQAGLIAFGGVPNRDSAYVRFVSSFFRPAGPAPKAAEGNLADALFVGSLVRALRELTDAIPASTADAKIGEVAVVVVRDLLSMAPRPGPEVEARAADGVLRVSIRPRRFAGVTLEEIALEVPLRAGAGS